jgi:hypothetical protein
MIKCTQVEQPGHVLVVPILRYNYGESMLFLVFLKEAAVSFLKNNVKMQYLVSNQLARQNVFKVLRSNTHGRKRPYTEKYDRNTGSCNTPKYGRIRRA